MWLKNLTSTNQTNVTPVVPKFILRIYAIMHITNTSKLDDVNATFKARFEQNVEYY